MTTNTHSHSVWTDKGGHVSEHPFRVIKLQCGVQRTRLRGMAKNRCKVSVIAAHTNLFMARRQLFAAS